MLRVIATRVVRLVATLLAVTFLTFTMLEFLPGDPIDAILPPNAVRTPELIAQIGVPVVSERLMEAIEAELDRTMEHATA